MNNYQDCEVEREMDVKDICFSLAKKWKQILIGSIIICVLTCCYGLVKAKKESTVSFIDEEITNAENAYYSYQLALKSQDNMLAKIKNSAITQIDSNEAVGRMVFYVVESDIDNIYSYNKTTNTFNDDEKMEIISTCGFVGNTDSIEDLVKISSVNDSSEDANTLKKTGIEGYIYANSTEGLDKIQSILENHMEEKNINVKSTYTKLGTVNDIDTSYILNSQLNLSEKLTDIKEEVKDLKNADDLTDNESIYFNLLIEEKELTNSASFNFEKYGVVGFGAGLLLMCFLYAMLYVLSDNVHASDDFKADGLDSLGTIDYTKDDKNHEMWLVSNVISFMKLHKLTKLYISLDYMNEKIESTLNTFIDELKKQNIDVVTENPLADEDSLNKLMSSEAIMLVETAEKSKYKSGRKMINLAKRQRINLVGSIVVKM